MSATGALPTFIIIGAMKCGTSSLHYYLSKHPDISMSMPKELNYFLSNFEGDKNLGLQGRNFERGLDWYAAHFNADSSARGESSPAYMDPRHLGVAKRMHECVPDALLIVLTRDPFDRAVSEYRHRVANGEEPRSLEEAILDPSSSYVALSRYHACLESFYEYFGPGKIIRYRQEDLDASTREMVESVVTTLGVSHSVPIEGIDKRINTASGRGALHRILSMGKGNPVRAYVARLLPSALKYKIDALSRQGSKSISQTDPTIESANGLRARFLALLDDDIEALNNDLSSGRLVEGFTPNGQL